MRPFAWVGHHTTFEPEGPEHVAATLVAQNGRRDADLAAHVDGWLADIERRATSGEFSYSLDDYAVLLREPLRRTGCARSAQQSQRERREAQRQRERGASDEVAARDALARRGPQRCGVRARAAA